MNSRRMRGRFFEHVADIWSQGDTITDSKPVDTSFAPDQSGVACYIWRRSREDAVTLIGRTDIDAATIYFPTGTPLQENGLIVDRTPGPNFGQAWMIKGKPIDEPGSRRAGPRMAECQCELSILPAEVTP